MDNRAFLAREFTEWSVSVPKDPGICESGHTWLILDKPGVINVYGAVTCYCRQYKIRHSECPVLQKTQGYIYMKQKAILIAKTFNNDRGYLLNPENYPIGMRRFILFDKAWKN